MVQARIIAPQVIGELVIFGLRVEGEGPLLPADPLDAATPPVPAAAEYTVSVPLADLEALNASQQEALLLSLARAARRRALGLDRPGSALRARLPSTVEV